MKAHIYAWRRLDLPNVDQSEVISAGRGEHPPPLVMELDHVSREFVFAGLLSNRDGFLGGGWVVTTAARENRVQEFPDLETAIFALRMGCVP